MSWQRAHVHTLDHEDFYWSGGDSWADPVQAVDGFVLVLFEERDGYQWTGWRPLNEMTWLGD